MTIKIFIRNNQKELQNVCFRLRDGKDIDLHYKSDIKVLLSDWDSKKSCIKEPSGNIKDESTIRLTKSIDKVNVRKTKIRDLYLEHPHQSLLTSDSFCEIIDRDLHPEKYVVAEEVSAPTTLFTHIAEFIKTAPFRKKKKANTYITKSTIETYYLAQKQLLEFAKFKGKDDFLLSEIDINFYDQYVDFLTKKKVVLKRRFVDDIEKQYSLNSIGNAVRTLKTFIADVKEVEVLRKDFYAFSEDVDNVFLNEDELQQLRDFDFSEHPHMSIAVDWFLLMAWTASRISDRKQLGNIKNGFIECQQQKTGNSVHIPVHPVVIEIITKYNGLPKKISDDKLNIEIKNACRLVGINSIETKTRTIGGKKVTTTNQKFELISSHTCRRSFCTNMYLRDMDVLMILNISGHRTIVSFLKYIKVSQHQHAERMAKKWAEIYK